MRFKVGDLVLFHGEIAKITRVENHHNATQYYQISRQFSPKGRLLDLVWDRDEDLKALPKSTVLQAIYGDDDGL